jgi:hypothetical protein
MCEIARLHAYLRLNSTLDAPMMRPELSQIPTESRVAQNVL